MLAQDGVKPCGPPHEQWDNAGLGQDQRAAAGAWPHCQMGVRFFFLTGMLLFSANTFLLEEQCAAAQRLPMASAGPCPGAAHWYGVAVRPS